MAEFPRVTNNEALMAFTTYGTIVVVKMMMMSVLTSYFRLTRKAFDNPEDVPGSRTEENIKKFVRRDDRVDRVLRAHRNDLENIVPFFAIGLLYSLSNPDITTAIWHFRIFVAARIYHSIAYVTPFPQPNRGMSWFIGYLTTFSMAYQLLKNKLYL
ncbi:microsomal glutathione S-transferase 1 [Trichosurus vulpecula]|uniref:microsomal glutathione S-transferase 1 n=1 Tax=Trichosurus vulpecula TaxID=9337 RepID=UPI00186B18E6|nr:microsomal glutathione S-transferase 1 [Trichosurus vulpecula]XP_036614702.1 microsomal glutathione S-transferase 1 [Trichosurus vulpecula]XP_036614703.1 microsomal glutathione S-transferase 1 [Trichosurus vulpecula]XP_036614704.1 microsomal glutathione S-transferase 1 [Trichosurus vulpecula]XP_036614705.1 microsomal glutathione S-transferase 1 [Trichosurus vulpecula]XP_036614706.1 microsomal glutathione S-transferase 1 [Trichosurus vulpecula]